MALKLDTLNKALSFLQEAITVYQQNTQQSDTLRLMLRDSIIQRFEYTYEMAWKIMQRWLGDNVSPEAAEPIYSRKELFRLAAKQQLISHPEHWFDYHKARNLSAHTYNEKNAEQVFKAAMAFPVDVEELISEIEKRHD